MGNSAFKTLGGVTPLKKGEKGAGSGKTQVRKVRAGTEGTKARTNRAQDKSGYSRPGADYINVHAFGPNTRVSDSLESTLGPSLSPAVRGMSNFGDTPEIDLIPPVEEGPNGDGSGTNDDLTKHHREKVVKGEVEVEKDGAAEDYPDFWDDRIVHMDLSPEEGGPSEGMLKFINDWIEKNPGKTPDLSKDGVIYKAWYDVSSSEEAKQKRKSSGYVKYRRSGDGLYIQEYHIKNGKEVYTGPWKKK